MRLYDDVLFEQCFQRFKIGLELLPVAADERRCGDSPKDIVLRGVVMRHVNVGATVGRFRKGEVRFIFEQVRRAVG